MSKLNIKLTSPEGVTLYTEGAYCDKDIVVMPELESITVTPTSEVQNITPSEGYAGIKQITVEAAPSDAEFNIAYGEIEPTDTNKLWVKTTEPTAVSVVTNPAIIEGKAEIGIASTPTLCEAASAVVGTKVYLFGGFNDDGVLLSAIRIFDTTDNTISTLNVELPEPAAQMGAAAVDKKVYLFGGLSPNIYVFDTETETIITLDTLLPEQGLVNGYNNQYWVVAAAVGTRIYVCRRGNTYLEPDNLFYEFNTETNTITSTNIMPRGGEGVLCATAIGTDVYFVCWGSYGYELGILDTRYAVYDPTYVLMSSIPVPMALDAWTGDFMCAAAVGTKVYLFDHRSVFIYDTGTLTISRADNTPFAGTTAYVAAAVDKKIYLFDYFDEDFNHLNTINVFDTVPALAESNLLIDARGNDNMFNLMPNTEIGINAVYLGNANGQGEKVAAALYKDGAWVEI